MFPSFRGGVGGNGGQGEGGHGQVDVPSVRQGWYQVDGDSEEDGDAHDDEEEVDDDHGGAHDCDEEKIGDDYDGKDGTGGNEVEWDAGKFMCLLYSHKFDDN